MTLVMSGWLSTSGRGPEGSRLPNLFQVHGNDPLALMALTISKALKHAAGAGFPLSPDVDSSKDLVERHAGTLTPRVPPAAHLRLCIEAVKSASNA